MPSPRSTSILRTKGLLPFLSVAFLNAFTDLGHKIILNSVVFKHFDGSAQMALTIVVNALILLPFVMTFSPAGFVSDKYPKNRVMKISALASVPIALLIFISYTVGAFYWSFALLFLLALQSAFYGPAKYGYLRELLGVEKLAIGNGVLEATTIIAILLGSFVYSILFEILYPVQGTASITETLQSVKMLGLVLIACATLETLLTLGLPRLGKAQAQLKFLMPDYFKTVYLRKNLSAIWSVPGIRMCMFGLGIFWGVNQVLLASFPAFFKEVTQNHNVAVALGIAAIAGVGIIIGSLLAGRISKNFIEPGWVPMAGLGMATCLLILPFLTVEWMMAILIFFYGFFGGLFLVPLNALIQYQAGTEKLGTVLAGKNFMEKTIMLFFLFGSLALAMANIKLSHVFLILFGVALAGASWVSVKMPQTLARWFGGLRGKKIVVSGIQNINPEGGILLVGKQNKAQDWAILQTACPRPLTLILDKEIPRRWVQEQFKIIESTHQKYDVIEDKIFAALEKGKAVAFPTDVPFPIIKKWKERIPSPIVFYGIIHQHPHKQTQIRFDALDSMVSF